MKWWDAALTLALSPLIVTCIVAGFLWRVAMGAFDGGMQLADRWIKVEGFDNA